jgi:glycosyltransferase involved in cell wall biosynthesis
MNILLLNYEYPPLGGGAGNATQYYAKEFAKMGHNVVVLTSALPSSLRKNNTKIVILRKFPSSGGVACRRHDGVVVFHVRLVSDRHGAITRKFPSKEGWLRSRRGVFSCTVGGKVCNGAITRKFPTNCRGRTCVCPKNLQLSKKQGQTQGLPLQRMTAEQTGCGERGGNEVDGIMHSRDNIHIYRIPALRKHIDRSNPLQMMAYVISSMFYCRKIIQTHKVEKVIAFMSIPSGITALFINIFFRIPYLIFLGGGDVPGSQSNATLYHKIIFPLRRSILKNAKNIVAVSEGLAQLSQKTDKYPVKVIHTGVDVDFYHPLLDTTQKDELRFLYVGRFANEKNVELIINQFKLLLIEGFNVRLDLVGDGPLSEILKKESLSQAGNIVFHNWIDKDTLRKVYQESDIMVNASIAEGLSNALLEAMSSGLAIVASDVIGNRDLIHHEDNGLLFSLDNENDLYKAMKRLINDQVLLNRLRVRSRQCVIENYSWEKSAMEYLNLL